MQGAKDKVQPSREAGVIYALGCMECPRVYVGETARTADLRSKEHQAHARDGRLEQSAVANIKLTRGTADLNNLPSLSMP